jgi:sugar phosphate isomerase/epimerase
MKPYQILPSTTSHKKEALLPTLELFARLELRDLDLNLNHLIERGVAVDRVRAALADNGQRVWIVSGGWCDFFDVEPQIQDTMASVSRQVAMARAFGVDRMRLFFGRLKREQWSTAALATIVANIQRLVDQYVDMSFVFENHDGVSSRPEICREILERVERPTARLNFDPINFEHAGVGSMTSLGELQPLIAHVQPAIVNRPALPSSRPDKATMANVTTPTRIIASTLPTAGNRRVTMFQAVASASAHRIQKVTYRLTA